jgi:hypothetical protein
MVRRTYIRSMVNKMVYNLFNNKLAVLLIASIIYIGVLPGVIGKLITIKAENYSQIFLEDNCDCLLEEVDTPLWEVGDSWVYNVIYNSSFEQIFTFSLSIDDFNFEVIEKSETNYKLNLYGKINGKLSIVEPVVISGELMDTFIEGYILVTKTGLSIEKFDANIYGSLIVPLSPKIPFDCSIIATINPVYDFLDFPIKLGEIWEIPDTDILIDLWYQIKDKEESINLNFPLWKDNIECKGREYIDTAVGVLEAYKMCYTIGKNDFYYAPMVGNIIKILENEEDLDFKWDLKSTTYGGPDKPDKPIGPTSGKTGIAYTYKSTTNDQENDQIYYMFDWGDGSNSGWIGSFDSGEEGSASYVWTNDGIYNIKVKAKDINGAESHWSNPLSVNMPKNKNQLQFNYINKILKQITISSF